MLPHYCNVCVAVLLVLYLSSRTVDATASLLQLTCRHSFHIILLGCSCCCLNRVFDFAVVFVLTRVAVPCVPTVMLLSTFLRLVVATQHVDIAWIVCFCTPCTIYIIGLSCSNFSVLSVLVVSTQRLVL